MHNTIAMSLQWVAADINFYSFLQSKVTFCTQPYLQEIEAEKDTFYFLLVTYIIKQSCSCVCSILVLFVFKILMKVSVLFLTYV